MDKPHETGHVRKMDWYSSVCQETRSGHGASRVVKPRMLEELLDTYQMWEEKDPQNEYGGHHLLVDREAAVSEALGAEMCMQK